MRVLLTNDDGYDAPGLAAIYRALIDRPEIDEVLVVAPLEAQSAMSHAITLHRPLTVTRRTIDGRGDPMPGFAVDGRPADCVRIALAEMNAPPIDLVVSGMNAGANIGLNVLYSGTVGAAREASFSGLPAVAVSLYLKDREQIAWDRAAHHGVDAMARCLGLGSAKSAIGFERGTVLNINVPALDDDAEPLGITAAELCLTQTAGSFVPHHADAERSEASELTDPPPRYMAAGTLAYPSPPPGSDVERLFEGWTVVTPLHFDLTHHDEIERLEELLLASTPTDVPA